VAKLPYIELANGLKIPILHEDRNVIAIDKPQGWMLAPVSWQNTGRNLFAALTSSVSAGDFWAKSRNLKFIRFVHRLDAETSGVLLLVKAPGALPAYTELFEDRKVQKVYLAVVKGVPEVVEWKCRLRLAPMQDRPGMMEINNALGKDSETLFRVIDKRADRALVMCWPLTGRTHQIRLHLAAVGHPIWGDELYGKVPTTDAEKTDLKLGLRSVRLSYKDPFMAEQVEITADVAAFVKLHGFDASNKALTEMSAPEKVLEHPKARLDETRRAEKEAKKAHRDAQRAAQPQREYAEDRPRRDWQQDEDSGGFADEPPRRARSDAPDPRDDRGRPPRERGERPFRPRAPRDFDRGPRRDSRYDDRPPRPAGPGRSFGGPRKFEDRGGGYNRRPSGGGYPERPERRERAGGFGRKPYAGSREFGDERSGGFGDRPPRRPGFGKKPFGPKGDFRERPERRSFDKRRDFDRGPRGGRAEDSRGGQLQTRPGVFPSSAKTGLKAGFQSTGFGPRPGRPTFRTSARPGRPQGKFSGAAGGKPGGPRKFGGGKFGHGKPGGGGGRGHSRGFGRGPR